VVPSKNVSTRGRCMAFPPPIPPKQPSTHCIVSLSVGGKQGGGWCIPHTYAFRTSKHTRTEREPSVLLY
jgi:hypothetical protein